MKSNLHVVVAAARCLKTVLMQLDTYRNLTVVVPLLVSEDEKALVTCISCLTKLCWQTSFRGAYGKIAFLFASAVRCIWQPKCRSLKGTHTVLFFSS
jgi:hypothetical protein